MSASISVLRDASSGGRLSSPSWSRPLPPCCSPFPQIAGHPKEAIDLGPQSRASVGWLGLDLLVEGESTALTAAQPGFRMKEAGTV